MRNPRKPVLAAALLAAALALASCGGNGDSEKNGKGDQAASPPRPEVLFRFQKFASAPLVDGSDVVTLRSLEGKVVVLDLFATWCPPCRQSVPILVGLHQRFQGKGLEMVGLAYENTDDAAQDRLKVAGFRQEMKIPYPLAIGPQVVWEELEAKAHADRVIPTILLLDRQGVVREMFQGLGPGEETALAERIEKLLAEPFVPVPRSD
jgi:thiol-disulfide isomerase/thioredoxin